LIRVPSYGRKQGRADGEQALHDSNSTGLAVGNGSIYIANYGFFQGAIPGPHGEVVSLPASLGS
jgi:hypothetical protein